VRGDDTRQAPAALKLGCIADDFTGATDLANNLVRSGLRVVQTIGVPDAADRVNADAVVVALKSRTVPAAEAVAQSLEALRWLQAQGTQQLYFKYCSTFDSVFAGDARGNIGPVTEALMDALGADFTVATPAFPDNQRTVFKGHLFVGDTLLAESGMRSHPLTPMTDSYLVRVLQAQCRRKVGLVDYRTVAGGVDAVRERMAQLRAQGVGIAVVDAVSNADLLVLGQAFAGLPLLTAGSGLAIGLGANFGIAPSTTACVLPPAQGARAVLSGSCSEATNAQVRHFVEAGYPAFAVDPLQVTDGLDVVHQALDWATPRLGNRPVLVYSSAAPASVHAAQAQLGVQAAGALVEKTLSAIAVALVRQGVRQLVVAGGETSGACVKALGVTRMQVGPQVAPGVPWCHAATGLGGHALHLLLKSGNFGDTDIFSQSFELLA
jgi:3-dehydrotetronate 4-kinase